MVFFVCEGCNETVKKNQVEKHVARCRNCFAVSCVDCQNTFYGDDYAAHTSCISEAEKYEKSLFKGPKAKINPQDAWMELVMDAISDCSNAEASIQPHLKRLGDLTNIPRNQKKFSNFIKNSLRLFNDSLIEKIWKYLESFKPKVESSTNPTNGIDNNNNKSLTSNRSSSVVATVTKSSSSSSNSDQPSLSSSSISDVHQKEERDEESKKKAKKEKKKEKKRQLELQREQVVEEVEKDGDEVDGNGNDDSPPVEDDEDDAAAKKARKKAKKEAKRRRLEAEEEAEAQAD